MRAKTGGNQLNFSIKIVIVSIITKIRHFPTLKLQIDDRAHSDITKISLINCCDKCPLTSVHINQSNINFPNQPSINYCPKNYGNVI